MGRFRRPRSLRTWGAVVCAGALLAECGDGAVTLPDPALTGDDADRCAAFADALPEELAGLSRRETAPEDTPGAAYGDPPVTVLCGGSMPPGFDDFSACDEVNGVGWYTPPTTVQDPADGEFGDAALGTITADPLVEVHVPGEHRPEGLAAVLAELAPYVREHLRQTRPCR